MIQEHERIVETLTNLELQFSKRYRDRVVEILGGLVQCDRSLGVAHISILSSHCYSSNKSIART